MRELGAPDADIPQLTVENPRWLFAGGQAVLYNSRYSFADEGTEQHSFVESPIARPYPLANGLDSPPGRDILNRLCVKYDLPHSRLGFTRP